MTIHLKRAYEAPASADGYRVLVDRLWPRGLAKQDAHLDAWLTDLAPSDALRRWFGHDPDRFAEFRARYRKELAGDRAQELIADLAQRKTLTLVYAAKDEQHNNAVVLAEVLARRNGSSGTTKPKATKRAGRSGARPARGSRPRARSPRA